MNCIFSWLIYIFWAIKCQQIEKMPITIIAQSPDFEVMYLNILICPRDSPKPKEILFTIIEKKEHQKIFTFDKKVPVRIYLFLLFKCLHQLIKYQDCCRFIFCQSTNHCNSNAVTFKNLWATLEALFCAISGGFLRKSLYHWWWQQCRRTCWSSSRLDLSETSWTSLKNTT